jgi:hypothetical protein
MNWYTWVWITLFALAFLFEIYVLVFGVEGGTLSEHLWALREMSPNFFSLLIFFLLWAIYHFIFQRKAT